MSKTYFQCYCGFLFVSNYSYKQHEQTEYCPCGEKMKVIKRETYINIKEKVMTEKIKHICTQLQCKCGYRITTCYPKKKKKPEFCDKCGKKMEIVKQEVSIKTIEVKDQKND
jgi:hypothetical protein